MKRKRKTFFQWVEEAGQAEVCRILGPEFYPVRVHRAFRAKHKLDQELVDRCAEVLGRCFDRDGTILEWHRLHKAHRSVSTAAEGGAA